MKEARFVVYQAKDGWRWRLSAANGRIIADSAEAYTRKRDAVRALDIVVHTVRLLAVQSEEVVSVH